MQICILFLLKVHIEISILLIQGKLVPKLTLGPFLTLSVLELMSPACNIGTQKC